MGNLFFARRILQLGWCQLRLRKPIIKKKAKKLKISLGDPISVKRSQTADGSLAGYQTKYRVEYDVAKLAHKPKALMQLIKRRLEASPFEVAYVVLKFRVKVKNNKTGEIYEKDMFRTLPRSTVELYLKGKWDKNLSALLGV